MVICDVKFDTKDVPVLQNSSQEPSTPSKYDSVLDAHLIMLFHDVTFDKKYDSILQNSSQEPSISSMYDFDLDILLFMLGS